MSGQKNEMGDLYGKCRFCGGTFSKAGMAQHLESCEKRKAKRLRPSRRRKSKVRDKRVFHVTVEGTYQPVYWMHLDVPAEAKLQHLDNFLRKIWVECCGHLSCFTIGDVRYERETGGPDAMWDSFPGEGGRVKSMKVPAGSVLKPGLKFDYEYDYGTTTYLTLRVLSEREEDIKDTAIRILARNIPPSIMCEVCGRPATQVCSECIYDNKGWLCDRCARKHPCDEEMLLPVVNSPRVGMCGYTGEL